jgi:glutathione S-transferase
VIKDLFKEFFPILFNPQFETIKDATWEKIASLYNKLVAYLGEKDFLVGTLSYSDFLFYELLSYFRYIYPASITPTVAEYINRFENLPGVKEYITNPNVNLKKFLNPYMAIWSGPK